MPKKRLIAAVTQETCAMFLYSLFFVASTQETMMMAMICSMNEMAYKLIPPMKIGRRSTLEN